MTDDRGGFVRAVEASRARGCPILVPAGTWLIEDRGIALGGDPITLGSGTTLIGEGANSVLRFRRRSHPAFYGIGLAGAGIAISDITLEVENGGGSWTAAAAAIELCSQLAFTRVRFRGLGARAGNYGFLPLSSDIDGLAFINCRFEDLELGISKQTNDVSTQTNILMEDCSGQRCTEVAEFNSPGLFAGEIRSGSAEVLKLNDSAGGRFDARSLRKGMLIRSIHLPPGTRIASIEGPDHVRFDRPALSGSNRAGARFSAGGCSSGKISRLNVTDIDQWGVGFANCDDWDVEVQGGNIGYELVHIEDACRNFNVSAAGSRCNLRPGVVGSPGAENGMVHVSTGSHHISVDLRDVDLRGGALRGRSAICVQAGGQMGTTGIEIGPHDISVSGRVLLERDSLGVIGYQSSIEFTGLELVNVDPRSRADPMLKLGLTNTSGHLRVRNPGRNIVARLGGGEHRARIEILQD